MQQTFNFAALVLARESRGKSQSELSEEIKIPQSVLSKIEHGLKTDISENVLDQISEKLRYPKEFFYQSERAIPISSDLQFHYRKGSCLKTSDQKRIEANAIITRWEINKLLQDVEIELNFKHYDLDDYGGSPSKVANAVRYDWKIPRGPINNLTEIIESNGIIIIQIDFGSRFVSGFSSFHADKYPIIFVNKNMPADRYRFTIAHELAHILMHNIKTENQEKEANEFASEFLVPFKEVQEDLCQINLKKLANLKQYWKVSMASLAMKLKEINTKKYTSLYTQLSAAGYRLHEPIELEKETPRLLDDIIKLHLNDLGHSVEDLSSILFINNNEFVSKYLYHNNNPKILYWKKPVGRNSSGECIA